MNKLKHTIVLLFIIVLVIPVAAQYTIDGTLKTETAIPVEDVNVFTNPSVITNEFGYYEINNLAGGAYTLVPTKNTDYTNGVTVCDMILMRNHILGIQFLDSPYKIISSDVNGSNALTTIDLVQLQRLILGLDETLPGPSWRFIDSNFNFPNVNNPFATGFPNSIEVNVLTEDITLDFIATKVGDVNNSAHGTYPTNYVANPDILFIEKELGTILPQNNYVSSFKAKGFNNAQGFQFTLSYDASKLEFVQMDFEPLTGNSGDINYFNYAEGIVNVLWFDITTMGVTIPDGQEIFTATFNVLEETDLDEAVQFTSEYTPIATMDMDGCQGEIAPEAPEPNAVAGAPSIFSSIELFPNPATEWLGVNIMLEEFAAIDLTLTNLLGQTIWQKHFDGKEIEEAFNISEFSGGIYLLEINANGKRTTKKVLISKP